MITHMSKSNVILSIFLVIGIVYLVWAVYAAYFKNSKEHFTEVKLTDYEARMAVMKVFDTVLHRKPLPDEIDKYAKVTNEQDMLIAVMTDYNVTTPPPTAATATVASATVAAPAPVAVPAAVATATTVTTPMHPSESFVTAAASASASATTLASASTTTDDGLKKEEFNSASSKKTNSNGAVSPSANPAIDLTAIETNLSSIVNTVNSIRALLYTQTMCEQ